MRIAICEDTASELALILETMQMFTQSKSSDAEIAVKAFVCGSDLLDFVSHGFCFDLFILDIIMPGINGIELATEIRETNKDCKIIFLTSSSEFAVKSYKVNALYYLLKPYDGKELLSLLDKVYESLQDEQTESVIIKEKTGLRRIPVSTIVYVESDKHRLNFHLRDGEIVVCYAKMEEYQDAFLSHSRFILCHKSFIVNMSHIAKVSNKFFILSDSTLIPISRTAYPQVKQSYIDYFFSKGLSL